MFILFFLIYGFEIFVLIRYVGRFLVFFEVGKLVLGVVIIIIVFFLDLYNVVGVIVVEIVVIIKFRILIIILLYVDWSKYL